jgi:hypothetical protein
MKGSDSAKSENNEESDIGNEDESNDESSNEEIPTSQYQGTYLSYSKNQFEICID